jgi:pimeloyl-ACP methyl ester carboxylesterase
MNAVVRGTFRTLSALSPSLAARAAGRLWFRIPRSRAGDTAKAFLATGERFTVNVDGHAVAAWRWGKGPAVILMHGWGGHAGQFQSIVQELTARGIAAVAFDAPSHGESAPGALGARYSTLFEFADALRVLASRTDEVLGVVAHSGGCAAVAWAMAREPKLTVRRTVFVAPFARPLKYMELFRQTLGLSHAALERFQRITEAQFRFRWSDLEVPEMTRHFTPPPTLVVHDRGDRETMWQDGADIASAWPGAIMKSTTGLGHNRILRDPEVVAGIVSFLEDPTAGQPPSR